MKENKQASHWHAFSAHSAPQCGVPSRAILVARSLSRQHTLVRWRTVCAMSCHLSRVSYELFTKCVTCNTTHVLYTISSSISRDILEKILLNISKFSPRHGTHSARIATHLHAHCYECFPRWHPMACQIACHGGLKRLSCQCEACFI